MLFNSFIFLVFFIAVYTLYRLLPMRPQNVLLLVASYIFYGWWDWRFLSLLLFSTVVDFIAGRAIDRSECQAVRKRFLLISMFCNLGLLGFFKYFNFFIDNMESLIQTLGGNPQSFHLNIILPVGISFYTFQTMSYTIDIYRGKMKATNSFLNFAVFVSFFPQLVAGPIERASHLLPQFENKRIITPDMIRLGLTLIIWGYFKKLFVADNMAIVVNQIYSMDPSRLNTWYVFLAAAAFAFQIYGDFSGYSDIARGLCKLMGFDLMINFRSPYCVTNPANFWRHWHISLSTWLRDYLYIPLGGNRGSGMRTKINLAITMVLGGLWHGANWNFVIWGVYQGALLMIFRSKGSSDTYQPHGAVKFFKWIGTSFLILVGWLIFRASDSNRQIFDIFNGLATFAYPNKDILLKALGIAFFGFLVLWEQFEKLSHHEEIAFNKTRPIIRYCIYFYILSSILLMAANSQQQFIYFVF